MVYGQETFLVEIQMQNSKTIARVEKLIADAKAGDSGALGALIESRYERLYLVANRSISGRLRKRVDPLDVVQDACLVISGEFERFQGVTAGEFAAWTETILKHRVSSHVTFHVSTAKRSVAKEEGIPADGPVERPGALSSAELSELREIVQESLDSLCQTQAEALRLKFVEDCSLAEIAENMGTTIAAVGGLLKRGLRALRDNPAILEVA